MPTGQNVFEVLVREHYLALQSFILACVKHAASADDLTQDVFTSAWRHFHDYDPDRPFAAWLRGIARNKILEFRRNRATAGRHVAFILDAEQIDAVAAAFDPLTAARGEASTAAFNALADCLNMSLDAEDQSLVRGVYHGGETCASFAALLGVTLEAIKKRLQRARESLGRCIQSKLGLSRDQISESLADA